MKTQVGKTVLYPIDRLAISLSVILTLIIGILILSGSLCWGDRCLINTGPKVRFFSWHNKVIDAQDTAFILKFSHPMEQESVQKNIRITIPDKAELENPLPGKFSWAGRRMAYTLDFPAPYGNTYKIELDGAQERFNTTQNNGKVIQSFSTEFYTPDRVFAYIGLEEEERGRLILYNLTRQIKKILTPQDLVVTEFKAYPKGEKILFSGVSLREGEGDILEQKLYEVKTGLEEGRELEKGENKSGESTVQLVLDNQEYKNLKFDLSEDGKIIVVQRVKRGDPRDIGLWLISNNKKPIPLNNPPGGLFIIAPDNETIASTQGEGIALLSLEPDQEPLQFFAKFGLVLNFSPDGTKAAMVDFNKNNPSKLYTRSLYLVSNQGQEEKILDTKGSIIKCEFTSTGKNLYCLLTNLLEGEEYQEEPYIASIDLQNKELLPLMTLPSYQDVQISLAPDGLGLLFDRIITEAGNTQENIIKTAAGEPIKTGKLWLLIPPVGENKAALEELPFVGFHPQWL